MRRDSITIRDLAASTCVLVAVVLLAAPAPAQISQYKPPGSVAPRPGDDREELEREMEDSLWQAGPFRLNPWIGITNAAFVSNAFNAPDGEAQESDLTMTLGAGLTGVVPFGSKVYLRFDAIPQYVFWLDQEERNDLNESYEARLFGFYNRLYLETGASRRDAVRVLSAENEQQTNSRIDRADVAAEVRLGGAVHLFAGAAWGEFTDLEDPDNPLLAPFSQLDRDEQVLRGGLRYRAGERFLVGLGFEDAETEFAPTARSLSNSGSYPFLELRYDTEGLFFTGHALFEDLQPEESSEFVPLDETLFELQATFSPGWRMDYTLYGRRGVTYALEPDYAYLTGDRYGLRLDAELAARWRSGAFLEGGADDYARIAAAAARQDDVLSWGLAFTFDVSRWLELTLGYSLTTFDSNLPGDDRDSGQIRLGFGVPRLVLGRR